MVGDQVVSSKGTDIYESVLRLQLLDSIEGFFVKIKTIIDIKLPTRMVLRSRWFTV